MNNSLGGRVRKTPSANVSDVRYEFITLRETEPDLGLPGADNGILSSNLAGARYWLYPSGGLAVAANGDITVDENTVFIDTSTFTYSDSDNLHDVLADLDQNLITVEGNALNSVATDDSLVGLGSNVSPLALADTIPGDRTFSNNVIIEGNLTVDGTITGNVSVDALLVGADVTISGNLTVNQTVISDNITANTANITSLTSNNHTVLGNLTVNDTISASNADISNLTVSNDLVVQGNLTVQGNTTTVNTETLTVEDAVIVLNSGQPTPSNDTGLILQRYSSPSNINYNVGMAWLEASDSLVFGSTTDTGTDANVQFADTWLTIAGNGAVVVSDFTVAGAANVKGNIDFISPDGNNSMSVSLLNSDTLSVRGDNGDLFSITDNVTGTIFSINDNLGFPILEVDADGDVRINEVSGSLALGLTETNPAAQLDVGGNIAVNGVIIIDEDGNFLGNVSGNIDASLDSATTDDLAEGNINLYYSNARVQAFIEDNELDFNAEKVDDRVANLLLTSGNLTFTYDDGANTLTLSQTLTTDDILEGGNLYYSNARVQAYLSSGDSAEVVTGNVTANLVLSTGDLVLRAGTGNSVVVQSADGARNYIQTYSGGILIDDSNLVLRRFGAQNSQVIGIGLPGGSNTVASITRQTYPNLTLYRQSSFEQEPYFGLAGIVTPTGQAADIRLYREDSGILGLRNGTNAQELRVYSTYSDASNYERLSLGYDAGNSHIIIASEAQGTGSQRNVFVSAPAVKFNSINDRKTLTITDDGFDPVITNNGSGAVHLKFVRGGTDSMMLNNDGYFHLWGGGLATQDLRIGTRSSYIRSSYFSTPFLIEGHTRNVDEPRQPLIIKGGSQFSSATTNQDGGNVILRGGASATGGGANGSIIIQSPDGNTDLFSVNGDGNVTMDTLQVNSKSTLKGDTRLQNADGSRTWIQTTSNGVVLDTANMLFSRIGNENSQGLGFYLASGTDPFASLSRQFDPNFSLFKGAGGGRDPYLGLGGVVASLNGNNADVRLYRDEAADTLALRRGTNAQQLRVYKSYTDASNYTRVGLNLTGAQWTFGGEVNGTGSGMYGRINLHSDYNTYIQSDGTGYNVTIGNRYGSTYSFGQNGLNTNFNSFGFGGVYPVGVFTSGTRTGPSAPVGNFLNAIGTSSQMWFRTMDGDYRYPQATNPGHGLGLGFIMGYGGTPTDANADGGDAGLFEIWLGQGGEGRGTGTRGRDGYIRIANTSAGNREACRIGLVPVQANIHPGIEIVAGDATVTDEAGADLILRAGAGDGTGADGNIIFQQPGSNTTVVAIDGDGNITANTIIANVTGQVSTISNFTTDDLVEGTANLYYSNNRVQAYLSSGNATDISVSSNISFISPDSNHTIQMKMLNSDTLSFEGNNGQLFSITDNVSGTVFSVNDSLGFPILEVDESGNIRMNEFSGSTALGLSNTNPLAVLDVGGNIAVNGTIIIDENGNFLGNVISGAEANLSLNDTDDLTEGNTNLYYSNTRVQSYLSSGDASNVIVKGTTTIRNSDNLDMVRFERTSANAADGRAKVVFPNAYFGIGPEFWIGATRFMTLTPSQIGLDSSAAITFRSGTVSAFSAGDIRSGGSGTIDFRAPNNSGFERSQSRWFTSYSSGSQYEGGSIGLREATHEFSITSIAAGTGVHPPVAIRRNDTGPAELRVYGTYTDSSNYERLSIEYNSANSRYEIVAQNDGSGFQRPLKVGTPSNGYMLINGNNTTFGTQYAQTLTLSGNNAEFQLSSSGPMGLGPGASLKVNKSSTLQVTTDRNITALEIFGGQPSSDVPVKPLYITGPSANPTAVTNMDGSDIILRAGASATGGGVDGNVVIQSADGLTDLVTFTGTGNVGIGTGTPTTTLQVVGDFSATTKSFVIDHPSKPDHKLRYSSLEGPEHGVYVRGKLVGTDTIQLPDYWSDLVDINTQTVSLTPVGSWQQLYVVSSDAHSIRIANNLGEHIQCDYTVYAERKDVDKLTVEYTA